jgi:uncharacterized protein YkwD
LKTYNNMRFSTGLTIAAAALGVDAWNWNHRWSNDGYGRYGKRPGFRPIPIGTAPIGTAPIGTAPIGTAPLGTAPFGTAPAPTATPYPTVIPSEIPVPTTLATFTRTVEEPSAPTSVEPLPTTVEEPSPSTTSTAPPAATTTAASSSDLTEDQQNALDAHNSARSEVGSSALVWDAELAANAQAYAEELISVGSLVHSGTQGEGENLYMGYDGTPLTSASNMWIDEKSSYSGEAITESNYQGFGHYTQIVWSSTTHVGLGSATDANGATYVVARYSPPGNMLGETAY